MFQNDVIGCLFMLISQFLWNKSSFSLLNLMIFKVLEYRDAPFQKEELNGGFLAEWGKRRVYQDVSDWNHIVPSC